MEKGRRCHTRRGKVLGLVLLGAAKLRGSCLSLPAEAYSAGPPQVLAGAHYFATAYDVDRKDALKFLQGLWRNFGASDAARSMGFSELLLQQVADELNQKFREDRQMFLQGLGPFAFVGRMICWDYVIDTEVLRHGLYDLCPPEEQWVRVLGLDLGWALGKLSNMGAGGICRARMQLAALRNLVYGTADLEEQQKVPWWWRKVPWVWHIMKSTQVFLILLCILSVVLPVPLLLVYMIMVGPSLSALKWLPRYRLPLTTLGALLACGTHAISGHIPHVYDHFKRSLSLYLTLAASIVYPALARLVNLSGFMSQVGTVGLLKGNTGVLKRLVQILLQLGCGAVVVSKLDAWARTMNARVPFLEAQLHLKLCQVQLLPSPD
ncbi:unnamed protein product [Effrenium voratum]|nr:unnamed protein product [Effrenium voratum]